MMVIMVEQADVDILIRAASYIIMLHTCRNIGNLNENVYINTNSFTCLSKKVGLWYIKS
jgi:hypothetical protein